LFVSVYLEMLEIAVGFNKNKKKWDRYKQYAGHEIYSQVTRLSQPLWLCMDGSYFKLDSTKKLQLACDLVAEYHNQNVYIRPEEDNYCCYIPTVEFTYPGHAMTATITEPITPVTTPAALLAEAAIC